MFSLKVYPSPEFLTLLLVAMIVTFFMSACHISNVRGHMSHLIFFARWWSQSVEGLLLTGYTPSCSTRCIGKSTIKKKYQVEYDSFSLGKSTILVLFPTGSFSYKQQEKVPYDLQLNQLFVNSYTPFSLQVHQKSFSKQWEVTKRCLKYFSLVFEVQKYIKVSI